MHVDLHHDEHPTIYLDMDGVLADFEAGTTKFLHRPWDSFKTEAEKKQRNKAAFDSGKQFWLGLPPMRDFLALYNYVRPFHPHILTAVPSGTGPTHVEIPTEERRRFAEEGKWAWIKTYLPDIPREHFHAVLRSHKQNYATKVVGKKVISNILIDDTMSNVIEFHRNRGTAIQHKTAADTIAQLKKLGIHNPAFPA